MLTIDMQVALWAVGIVFVGGGMYADVRTRLGRMEKMMGNGTPGVFARRDELAMMLDRANEAHTRMDLRAEHHEERLLSLERKD